MKRGIENCEPISLDELDDDVRRYGISMLDEYRALDNWMRCEVEPPTLRSVHGDFERDGVSVKFPKGVRFDQLLEHFRGQIDNADFPLASHIRAGWSDKPPVVVLRMIKTGELYLCDGQKRVFNACYHGESSIRALLVHVDEDREIVEHFP